MSTVDNNDNLFLSDSDENNDGQVLETLFTSVKWIEYIHGLSKTLDIVLSVYDSGGSMLCTSNENPFCNYIKSAKLDSLDCPGSCDNLLRSDEVRVFRCSAGVTCFVLPIERFNGKVIIVGRGEFASYGDFLDYLKILRDNKLSHVPVSMPLKFPGEEYIETACNYVRLSFDRLLDSIEEKSGLKEKLLRMTALFDRQALGTLSKEPELMYRYILDTIEFVYGQTTSAFLVLDETSLAYKTVYSSGKDQKAVSELNIEAQNTVINKMRSSKSAVFLEDLHTAVTDGEFAGIGPSHFFPIFVGSSMDAVIGIFNKKLSREDVNILNAFREYVSLNLENQKLRVAIGKNRKADEKLTYLADITNSIVSILDKEKLLNTLLDKSMQLISAEQGSLMLLDSEKSELVVEAKRCADDIVQEKMRFKKDEGISGMVLQSGSPFLVEDIEQDPRTRQTNRPRYRTKSFVSVPIQIEDRLAGVLNLSDKIKGNAFNKDDVNLLETFISSVAIAIERSILYKHTESLQKLSITDPLTGIYNRRYLNRRLSEEITRYNRYKHPFSFMMLDLDKFKDYNDTFGHIAGDNLIRNLATVMDKSLRTIDIAARFGGDEFVAIFPQTPKVDAIQISNRLKEKIDLALHDHNIEMPLSVSVGLATFPDDASSIMELIEKTDQALYLAKKGGGNRVVYL